MRYKKIRLSRSKTRDEHRLIMEQIIGRKLTRNEVVHHRDGNKQNNDPSNLEIMHRDEHSRLHMTGNVRTKETKDKLKSAGVKHRTNAKLTIEQVKDIRDLLNAGIKCATISRRYNVCKETVYDIRDRRTWYWI